MMMKREGKTRKLIKQHMQISGFEEKKIKTKQPPSKQPPFKRPFFISP